MILLGFPFFPSEVKCNQREVKGNSRCNINPY